MAKSAENTNQPEKFKAAARELECDEDESVETSG